MALPCKLFSAMVNATALRGEAAPIMFPNGLPLALLHCLGPPPAPCLQPALLAPPTFDTYLSHVPTMGSHLPCPPSLPTPALTTLSTYLATYLSWPPTDTPNVAPTVALCGFGVSPAPPTVALGTGLGVTLLECVGYLGCDINGMRSIHLLSALFYLVLFTFSVPGWLASGRVAFSSRSIGNLGMLQVMILNPSIPHLYSSTLYCLLFLLQGGLQADGWHPIPDQWKPGMLQVNIRNVAGAGTIDAVWLMTKGTHSWVPMAKSWGEVRRCLAPQVPLSLTRCHHLVLQEQQSSFSAAGTVVIT